MKKLIPYIATVAALSLSVFCMFQISDLKDDIRRMENNFRSELSVLESNYSNIIALTERRLEEHASILTRKEFTYGGMDLDKGTVELLAAITPKEHQPNVTEAILVVNGTEYPMELTEGAYKAAIEVPLFEDTAVSSVVFKEGGTVRTEALDWWRSPHHELLPSVSARLGGSGRGSAGDGVYTWRRTGEVRVSLDSKGKETSVRSVSLIEELDGKEINRIEIPLGNTQSSGDGEGPFAAVPEPYPPEQAVGYPNDFYYDLDKDFNIPFGSMLNLLAEVVDADGLRYRVVLEHWEIDENGNPVDDDAWAFWHMAEWIIGPDGEVLYEVDEGQYR